MAEVIRYMIAIPQTSLAFPPSREAPQSDAPPGADAFGQVFDDAGNVEKSPDPNEAFVGVPPLSLRGVLDVATADGGATAGADSALIGGAPGQVATDAAKDGSAFPAQGIASDGPDDGTPHLRAALADPAPDDAAILSDDDGAANAGQAALAASEGTGSAPALASNPADAAVQLASVPGLPGPKPAMLSAAFGKDMQIKAKEAQDQRDPSHGSPSSDPDTSQGSGMFRLITNANPATGAWAGPANAPGAKPGQTDLGSDHGDQTGLAWDSSADGVVLAHSSFAAGRIGDGPMAPPGPNLPQQIATSLLAVAAQSPGQPGLVEVILSPQELGPVRLEFRTDGDWLHVLLATERPETMDLMRRHGDALVAELRQAGYAGASLSFGQWGQSQRDARAAAMPALAIPMTDLAAKPPMSIPSSPSARPGGLHLRF